MELSGIPFPDAFFPSHFQAGCSHLILWTGSSGTFRYSNRDLVPLPQLLPGSPVPAWGILRPFPSPPTQTPPVKGNSLSPGQLTGSLREGEMRPVEWRPEILYHLPGQNQTPAFLRRKKSEPQRSNEEAEKIQGFLLVAKKISQGAEAGSRWLT